MPPLGKAGYLREILESPYFLSGVVVQVLTRDAAGKGGLSFVVLVPEV